MLAIGLAAGVLLRPLLGVAYRSLSAPADNLSPKPFSQPLWDTKSEQYRIIDAVIAQPCIVYLGDSTTDRAHVEELLSFNSGLVLNRGIAGDTTHAMLKRLGNSLPEEVEVCFLLIGYNDLEQHAAPRSTADRIARILKILTSTQNVKHVVLETLLPSEGAMEADIRECNAYLVRISNEMESVSLLNLHALLSNEQGGRLEQFFASGPHLNAQGCLRRLRAEVDHLRLLLPTLAENVSMLTESDR